MLEPKCSLSMGEQAVMNISWIISRTSFLHSSLPEKCFLLFASSIVSILAVSNSQARVSVGLEFLQTANYVKFR